jgi:hypothetical protein
LLNAAGSVELRHDGKYRAIRARVARSRPGTLARA